MGRLSVELPEWSENAARAQSQDMVMDSYAIQQAQMGEEMNAGMLAGEGMPPGAGMPPEMAPQPGMLPQPYMGGAPEQLAPGEPPIGPQGGESIANELGIVRPGMGMADTIGVQLGRTPRG